MGKIMKRRDFFKKAAVGSVAATTITAPAIVSAKTKIKWKMVTTWPKNFPVLGTGANQLAKLITEYLATVTNSFTIHYIGVTLNETHAVATIIHNLA